MIDQGYHVSKVTMPYKRLLTDTSLDTQEFYVVRHNGFLLGRMKTAKGLGIIKCVGHIKYAQKLYILDDLELFIEEHRISKSIGFEDFDFSTFSRL